ncbi:hypothetical protein L1281_002397 [Neisseria sp. HSC-16F19]|nr:BRO family protein [Neisseria sp. HSC-16F19]MCP2041781.1 hypothetical protein [Neisseria sp. HSC-16F19]
MSHLIQSARFRDNIVVSIHDHHNQFWLTAEDVGRCLGYAPGNERVGITRVYNRHADEFLPEDSTVVKLTTVDEKQRDVRVFSKTGCIKLGFFSATQTAKEFRTWAARVLAGGSADAAMLEKYKAAFIQAAPQEAKLIEYYRKGLTLSEIGKLLDLAPGSVAHRLKKLAELDLVDYRPDPVLSARGKRGRAQMLANRAQHTLNLED